QHLEITDNFITEAVPCKFGAVAYAGEQTKCSVSTQFLHYLQLGSGTACKRTRSSSVDLSSVPRDHIRHLTTACPSGSKGSKALFWFPQVPIQVTYVHTDTQTCPQIKVLTNISLKMVL
ncbi:hypothetical protein LEMLEM_LOCUS16123, partial [Lemmus lemmus]